jgi:hypothetical protein
MKHLPVHLSFVFLLSSGTGSGIADRQRPAEAPGRDRSLLCAMDLRSQYGRLLDQPSLIATMAMRVAPLNAYSQ